MQVYRGLIFEVTVDDTEVETVEIAVSDAVDDNDEVSDEDAVELMLVEPDTEPVEERVPETVLLIVSDAVLVPVVLGELIVQ